MEWPGSETQTKQEHCTVEKDTKGTLLAVTLIVGELSKWSNKKVIWRLVHSKYVVYGLCMYSYVGYIRIYLNTYVCM